MCIIDNMAMEWMLTCSVPAVDTKPVFAVGSSDCRSSLECVTMVTVNNLPWYMYDKGHYTQNAPTIHINTSYKLLNTYMLYLYVVLVRLSYVHLMYVLYIVMHICNMYIQCTNPASSATSCINPVTWSYVMHAYTHSTMRLWKNNVVYAWTRAFTCTHVRYKSPRA